MCVDARSEERRRRSWQRAVSKGGRQECRPKSSSAVRGDDPCGVMRESMMTRAGFGRACCGGGRPHLVAQVEGELDGRDVVGKVYDVEDLRTQRIRVVRIRSGTMALPPDPRSLWIRIFFCRDR